ncbi:MAG: hypothetical protein AAGC81_01305 [Pseudomonadota bacterium]
MTRLFDTFCWDANPGWRLPAPRQARNAPIRSAASLVVLLAAPVLATEPNEIADRCLAASISPDGIPRCMAMIATECAAGATPGEPIAPEDARCRIAHANSISLDAESALIRAFPNILPKVYRTIEETCAANQFPDTPTHEVEMKVAGCASAYWLAAYGFFQNEMPQ